MVGLKKGNEPEEDIDIEEKEDVGQKERVEVVEPVP